MPADPDDRLDRMLAGIGPAMLVGVVAELGLADRLAEGPRTIEALAAPRGLAPRALERALRALAGQGLFREDAGGLWHNTPSSERLREGAPEGRRGAARFGGLAAMARSWAGLLDTLATQKPAFEAGNGGPFFTWLEGDAAAESAFAEYMGERTAALVPRVLARLELGGARSLLELGGGDGALLAALLEAHPELRGGLVERPAAAARARARLGGFGPRAEVFSGDFFAPLPTGYDAILVKEILHDWDDADAQALLERCRDALAPGARLHLIEWRLDGPAAATAAWMDVLMMVHFGGRERSGAELEALLERAGFGLVAAHPLAGGPALLTAVKR